MKVSEYYPLIKNKYKWFGFTKTALFLVNEVINLVIFCDCFHIIVLERERSKCPPVPSENALSCRFATEEDMTRFQTQPEMEIDDVKMKQFHEGDFCLLNYVGPEVAGYTWAHLNGRPELIPGLRIKVPDKYIYNYGALTLREFRGQKHQSWRHFQLLQQPQWKHKRGLLGYVKYTNWSSIRGQTRSGYHSIGRLWMVGTKSKFFTYISKSLREIGIQRIVD